MNIFPKKFFFKNLLLPILSCFLWQACTAQYRDRSKIKSVPVSQQSKTSLKNKENAVSYPSLDSLITLQVAGHLTDIMSPSQVIKGNILVLPGWDFPRQDWCNKSTLCKKALTKGYRLILPEMDRSIYSSRFYKETRSDWAKYPNKVWLCDSLIPALQQKGILKPEQSNYILGLSTGGRGVAMVILAKPQLFKAGAALSGDFDQTKMPADRLMIGYYGSYQQFPERWAGEDNPLNQVQNFQTPIYLGHGKQDNIVPHEQTILFYNALKKARPNLKIKLNLVDAKHDYAYWDSEVENMLGFFEEVE